MIQFYATRCPSGAHLCRGGPLRTLGSLFYALLLQGQNGATLEAPSQTIIGLLARSGPITKIVLLILALFSIASWSIILYKLWTFRRSKRQTASFLEVFRRSN